MLLKSTGLLISAIESSLPIALLDALLDLALRQVALERAEIIYEQLAVKVVRLVRYAARFEVHHVQRQRAAVRVLRANDKALRPRDLNVYARKAQTAFFPDLLAFFSFDHGVDERDFLLLV